MGAQSFDARHLATLGRIHGPDEIGQAVEMLRAGGIGRLSLDLILAVPGQSLEEQARDAREAVALSPEHVSAYVLTYEEGTAFARRLAEGRMPAPSDEREWEHLHLVRQILEGAGLVRYEISNYALPGRECRHNLAYWRDADWIGLGAGAHSHLGDARWKNLDDPALYARRVLAGEDAREWTERSGPEVRAFERVLMGLRLAEGVDLEGIRRDLGVDLALLHGAAIEARVAEGLLAFEPPRLRLTPAGFDVANRVILDFAP
jgi:oxygen-independent coproporphyrinogen-3 oxidase